MQWKQPGTTRSGALKAVVRTDAVRCLVLVGVYAIVWFYL